MRKLLMCSGKKVVSSCKFLCVLVALLSLTNVGRGQVLMSTSGSNSQNFNSLATTGTTNAWTDNSTISNWYSQRSGTGTQYAADAGTSNGGNLYSYGTSTNSERALGTIGSGGAVAGSFAHGVLLRNTSGGTITDIKVSYTLEQWRNGGNTTPNTITFWYKTSSSTITALNPNSNATWTQVVGLSLSSPINTATATSLDGNAVANRVSLSNVSIPSLTLANNDYIMLKWEDPDHTGADHGLAIDDVTITWTTTTCTDVSISSQPSNTSVQSPSAASFSVTASGTVSSYQWQLNTGSGWNDLSNVSPYSNVNLATLNINPTAEAMSDYQYRCVITAQGSCSGSTSDPGTLTVNPGPCGTESFANLPSTNAGSYVARAWTGDNGATWSATAARTDQTINSSKAICIRRNDVLTSPSIAGGIGSLTFTTNFPFSESVGNLEIRVNGTLVRTILFAEMNAATPVTFTINNINQSGNVIVTFTSTAASGTNSRFSIDNVNWSCYSGCTPTQTITGFIPTSGTPGTIVTISGTGFTGATAIKFGGVSSTSFTVIDDNTIQAEVPTNAISGTIGVTKSSCEQLSNTEFLILTNNNNCGTGTTGSDLMISEVFDSNVGALGYIEIFNPTASSINLSGYYIRINTGATTNLANFSSYNLASGAVAVISAGDPSVSGTSLCTSVTIQQFYNSAPGFNTSDEIALMKGASGSGTVLDVVSTPSSSKGFTQLRNNGIINPRNTYLSSEWTNADPEACSNLGIAPTSLSSVDVTINTQPSDNTNCSTVTFSVSATASSGTITSYSWKYNDSKTMTGWLDASGLSIASGTNTATLTLSGNIADYQNYQFYCVITKTISGTTCERYSNAAQYTYNTKAFYRSKNDGSWTDASTWEMSDTENGTYINACQYPIALNSTKVNILNTHDVILDVIDLDIDWLKIQSGGSLKIENSSLLTFNNGNTSGADLEVDGTLTDNGSIGNGISFATSAGWILGSSATLIRTSNSSSSVYRNNYENGMSNIPATANWIIRYTGVNDVTFTTTNGTFYPNLTFESTSALWDPLASATSSRFSGNSDFATVKGNLDIGGSGTGTVTIYNENNNPSPMLILGNLIVRTANTLTNNGTLSGTGFEVKGNVTVDGALTVNGNGTTGKLVLSGSTMQTISGSGTMNLQDVEINNSKSDPPIVIVTPVDYGVTLARPISISGILTLTDGLVNTSITNLLTLTATASSTSGSDASFVNGPIKKIGNTAFSFPVGKPVQNITVSIYNPSGLTGGWRPISISAPGNVADAFTAEFMHFNANLIGSITSPGLQAVSACEYWGLKRESSTDVSVTLTWKQKSICTPAAYVANPTPIVVAISSNGIPLSHTSGNWTNHGGSGTITAAPYEGASTWNTVPIAYYKNSSLSSYAGFTPFTLGTTNWQQAPLPYTLSTFKASAKEKGVQLDWQVLHNDRVRSYTVERSKDGVRFAPLKLVAARLNEHNAAYIDNDPAPFKGWGYYRLRITDFDGNSTYSATQKVWMGNAPIVQVSPNPVKDQLFINTGNITVKEISLVNYLGQTMLRTIPISTSTILDLSKFNAGIYYVRILTNEGVLTEQVIKQ